MQLLQAIGRQREAAEPDAASGAAAEAVAGAVLEAAAAPAEGAASTQPQQADQQDKAAGKRPLTAGQAADAAAQQQHRPAQQGGQQAQQQEASSAAAVQLRGILAVGMQPEQARRVSHKHGLCVRGGCLGRGAQACGAQRGGRPCHLLLLLRHLPAGKIVLCFGLFVLQFPFLGEGMLNGEPSGARAALPCLPPVCSKRGRSPCCLNGCATLQ